MIRRLEIFVVYVAGMLQGLSLVTFAASSPIFTSADFHGLTESQYGTLYLPMIVFAIVSSSLGGAMAKKVGLKKIFFLGLCFNFLSLLLVGSTQKILDQSHMAYALLLTAMGFMGLGFGSTISSCNSYAAGFFPKKSGTALNALHAIIGVGTALSPLSVNFFLNQNIWWMHSLVLAGFLLLAAVGSLVLPLAFPSPSSDDPSHAPSLSLFHLPAVLYGFGGLALLYGLCETTFGNWGVIYLNKTKGLSLNQASFALSLFWGLVTVGRILAAVVTLWVPSQLIYKILPLFMAASFVAISFVSHPVMCLVLFAVAGLSMSAYFPLCLDFVTQRFSSATEFISGFMMASYMMGFGLASFGIGWLQETWAVPLNTIFLALSGFAILIAVGSLQAKRA